MHHSRKACAVSALLLSEMCIRDRPIPGLYMAGNDCGRRFGTEYVTPIPGCSLAFALVLGRECGKSCLLYTSRCV